MIGRAHRFHGYGSLRRVYANGKTARGTQISLRYASRGQDRPYRVAVVVSRKVSKSAVTRGRIRRRIYEIVRQAEFVPAHTDLVFTVFSDHIAELESAKLQATVTDLLQKATAAAQKTV